MHPLNRPLVRLTSYKQNTPYALLVCFYAYSLHNPLSASFAKHYFFSNRLDYCDVLYYGIA